MILDKRAQEMNMNKIREIFNEIIQKPLYAGIAGLVIGLIIGLPILGWGLWPVKWTDADPSYLRDDLKSSTFAWWSIPTV